MNVENTSPATAYLTKPNIVHPGSAAQVAALEARARAEIGEANGGVTVTGGSIKRG